MPLKLLLIEDDPVMGEALQLRLDLEGVSVQWCRRIAEARAVYERGWDVVLCDVRLPDGLGTDWFAALPTHHKRNAWYFLTGYGSIEQAVQAVRGGARAYITKPFDVEDLVRQVCAHATDDDAVLGPSPPMRSLYRTMRRIAATNTSVLITGETGVGKEVAARHLHALDPKRAGQPLVAVNCAAIPETMLEAECFGYERGAFTGAQRTHKGYLEMADGGTLFLDEVAELPLPMQAKLLRALQEKAFYRLGGERLCRSDFRLVCATNRDLHQLVEQGLFREDLYYRIAVVRLHIPPLRERPEDIEWLTTHWLQELALQQQRPLAVSDTMLQWLRRQPWRGNVRELKAFLEREAALSEHGLIDAPQEPWDTVGATPATAWPQGTPLQTVVEVAERMHIVRTLQATQGNVTLAAQQLDISRKTLWEKMRRFGIDRHHVLQGA
ncbi:MAG: sigma-54-dependent transcriptional regulator [Tepidimonas ignava]